MSNRRRVALAVGLFLLIAGLPAFAQPNPGCTRTVKAKVSALDLPFFLNRLGAMMPEGMIFALDRDIVPLSCPGGGSGCKPSKGNAWLREGKRPRPIVLRANVGDCLQIEFTNLLSETVANQPGIKGVQPATRYASIHVAGMQVVQTMNDDGSFVGVNGNSLAAPGEKKIYLLRATAEGTFLLNSEGAAWGGLNFPNDGAQVTAGLFGAVNVEPADSVWLRSQITNADMLKAVDKTKGTNGFTPMGQPILNFDSPVLQMLDPTYEIVATDLTAIIAGPKSNGYRFRQDGDPNTSPVPYEPRRDWPFREFTIEYHELNDSQQAFPIFDYASQNNGAGNLTPTLQAGGDAFAINYGSGGIGAEILANRFGVGPMNSCPDCRFEEFFLSSWTVGDPSMVVDSPANAPCNSGGTSPPDVTNQNLLKKYWANCTQGSISNAPAGVTPLRKATKVSYPDDPSNVYHSYINDRVIFRTLHSGTGVSHVHHLHAHQWFHSPNSDGSAYLDSQLINPGSAYTMEIAHEGSGNLNKVVGDSIFHCHFYPHFAAGMWAHWRSHDVFEIGTTLDSGGKPVSGWNRAQPDGEIAAGTPIPALVPMPTLPMAPMPARVRIVPVADPNAAAGAPPVGYRAETNPDDLNKGLNPGYPFFIPGVGGTRAPHPPMDFAKDSSGTTLDGGLPRHMIINAAVTEQHNYLDFSKDMANINAYKLPEDGTDVEKVAMAYHAQCTHPTFDTSGAPASYRTNGLPAAPGAPYADPGLSTASDSDTCTPIRDWTTYKAAVVQTDLVLNKLGWHYPQSRLLTLWQDVLPTVSGTKPPEPFFFRANSRTGVNYWHTNLVPEYYDLDDYQVRTPTDIIGQHIHLVKFDVTSSDGAANGFNYEDGTLSYQEVQSQVKGITQCGGLAASLDTIAKCNTGSGRLPLTLTAPPAEICPDPTKAPCSDWFGAQTTVQRWYADPLSSDSDRVNGERTLRTVFTHDHFGPSTHQQVGLYAALVVEPTASKWYTNDTKTPLHTRTDGGPTSFAAIIETPGADEKNTYREFLLALQDFQFAYLPTSISQPGTVTGKQNVHGSSTPIDVTVENSWADPANVVEPPLQQGTNANPGPALVSAGPTSGTLSFNYRNEPLPFRVSPSTGNTPATDLSYVFASNITRNNPALNVQPTPGSTIGSSGFKYPATALTPGMMGGDPYTPLLRAYEGDRVQIRVITGAHMLPHDFTVHGMKWLFEPSFNNSGYRNNQSMGISEHFEFLFETPRASPSANADANWSDYLYMPDASNQRHGIVDGMWGLFRAYKSSQSNLAYLATNPTVNPLPARVNGYSCPDGAPLRQMTINAFTAGNLTTYNSRGVDGAGVFPSTRIGNQYQLMYQFLSQAIGSGAQTPVTANIDEPLVLRANAGDCIALTLKNEMNPTTLATFPKTVAAFDPSKIQSTSSTPPIKLGTSNNAGITPGLLSYDVMTSSGMNVGFNPVQTVAPNGQQTYYWYAGQTKVDAYGKVTGTSMELGGTNLTPSDPLQQDLHGLVGGLVVEPAGSVACVDTYNPRNNLPQYASATIYDGGTCSNPGNLKHREFVMITTEDMSNLQWSQACYCPAKGTGPSTGPCLPCRGTVLTAVAPPLLLNSVINYRVEPMSYRFNATSYNGLDTLWRGYSDGLVAGEPQTPIFAAARNTPTRFHLLHPGGSGDQQVMALHGHVWQELPYINDSKSIGDNKLSMWLGKRDNYGTNTSYSIILDNDVNGKGGAGGQNGVMGDYLYRTTPANFLTQGLWGLFRVGQPGKDTVAIGAAQFISSLTVSGSTTVFLDSKANPQNGQRAKTISLSIRKKGTTGTGTPLKNGTINVGEAGLWNYNSGPISLSDPSSQEVVAVSPFGGMAVAPVTLNLVPGTPASAQQPGQTLGESIRFVNMPRDTVEGDGPTNIPTAKPEEGLLGPQNPEGAPQAPKSTPVPVPQTSQP